MIKKPKAIATLTLNPAIDRTLYFPTPFQTNHLNRAASTTAIPGGKGMNVSKVISLLSRDFTNTDESISYCLLGGEEGETISRWFKSQQMESRCVKTSAASRVNIKLIDSTGSCTEANEAGGPVSEAEITQLINKISTDAQNGDFSLLVLGGSIPQGVDKSVYKSIAAQMKALEIECVLDCDGEALLTAMSIKDQCPSLIKPNLFELSQYCGQEFKLTADPEKDLNSLYEITRACVDIFVEKSTAVICTLSEFGSLYTGKEGTFYTTSPKNIKVRGFAGAGDTFLAAYLWTKYTQSMKIEECLKKASSAASAKIECEGASLPPSGEDLFKFANDIRVIKLR
jgi:Fructose-1-phosphate kinase and related fructose-6-phosphate kinase (PfkB)